MGYELSGRSARYSAVTHLPLITEQEELFILHCYAVSVGKSPYDGMIKSAIGLVISDGYAETVSKGKFLFHGIRSVDITVLLNIIPVGPHLTDEMAPV